MSPGQPVQRARGERPDEGWREDALVRSQHSRVLDFLQLPLDDPDPDRAVTLCAEVARNALEDFAPILLLLSATERRRVQVAIAYSLMLFDFALQPGTGGERLAELNRWEFDRELAFDDRPPGQPVFVALAAEHRRRPFDDDAFDRLASLARQVAVRPRPTDRARAEQRWRALADALLRSNDVGGSGVDSVLLAALRLRRLQGFTLDRALVRSQVPLDEWPARADDRPSAAELERFAADECRRIRAALSAEETPRGDLPRRLDRAATYLESACAHLLRRFERRQVKMMPPPRLGLVTRLRLLAQAALVNRPRRRR